ncbi:hypothetical protein OIU76_018683 [Salix suchowensis]|nr:hypothetical protein OIU76_018683 [Salix suchowensis]
MENITKKAQHHRR